MTAATLATPSEADCIRRDIAPRLYAFTAALGGATQGFVTVTLGYVLAREGLPVGAIATLIGLRLLPETWRIIFGPLVDVSLNPRLWFLIAAAVPRFALSALGLSRRTGTICGCSTFWRSHSASSPI